MKLVKDYIIIGVIGLFGLLISYYVNYQGLSWSDEVVYAAAARNVVTTQSLNTNYYRTDSIIRKGFPTRDVHMPGHILVLALSFAIFGFNDAAAVLPSQISYVLAGLILFDLGRRLFNRAAAWLAVMLFFLYPINVVFANSAMSELPLTLLVVLYLWLWVKINQSPGWPDAVYLALLLALGIIYRETYLVLLPPALYLIWRWSKNSRDLKPVWLFGVSFGLLALILIYPLAQNRAFYPNRFNMALETGGVSAVLWGVLGPGLTKVLTLQGFFPTENPAQFLPQLLISLFQLFLGVIVFAGLFWFNQPQKRLVGMFGFAFWSTTLVLTGLYLPPITWETMRSLAALIPAGLLIVAGLVVGFKSKAVRYIIITLLLIYLGNSSFLASQTWRGVRQDFLTREQRISRIIDTYTIDRFAPPVILSTYVFLYGWEHYPTITIWTVPTDEEMAQQLLQKIPQIGLVVIDKNERHTPDAPQLGKFLLAQGFELAGVDGEDIVVFVKQP